MGIKVDTAAFTESLKAQRQAIADAARPSAQAGAEHIYRLARLACPEAAEAHWFYGKASKNAAKGAKKQHAYLFQPGNLRDSIYQVFSKGNSTDGKATYHVSWNHQTAPYGYMVEYGTSRAPAHPFMEPAIIEGRATALVTMQAEFRERTGL